MKKGLISALFFLLLTGANANAWEFNRTLSLNYLYEKNLTAEAEDRWRINDHGIETEVRFAAESEYRPGKRWILELDIKNHDNNNFSVYDRLTCGFFVSHRRKFGLGALAPWLKFRTGFGEDKYKNDDLHSRRTAIFQMEYGRRINLRTIVSGGLGFDQSFGNNTNVLDLKGISANIRGQYSMNSKWAVTGGFQKRKGDVTVHGWEDYYNFSPSVYMEDWPVWNGKEKIMYKVSGADTLKWEAGLVFAIGKEASCKLNHERYKTTIDSNSWSYNGSITKLQYNFNF